MKDFGTLVEAGALGCATCVDEDLPERPGEDQYHDAPGQEADGELDEKQGKLAHVDLLLPVDQR